MLSESAEILISIEAQKLYDIYKSQFWNIVCSAEYVQESEREGCLGY